MGGDQRRMTLLKLILACVLRAGRATAGLSRTAPQPAALDAIAREYVTLSLEIGERDDGYVDAYYGPPEWREAARANPRSIAALAAEAERLHGQLLGMDPAGLDFVAQRRLDTLTRQIVAARTRLRMLQGERIAFVEEAQGLYGVTPLLRPLSDYDPVL